MLVPRTHVSYQMDSQGSAVLALPRYLLFFLMVAPKHEHKDGHFISVYCYNCSVSLLLLIS